MDYIFYWSFNVKIFLCPDSIFLQPNLHFNVCIILSTSPRARCLWTASVINSRYLFSHSVFTLLPIKHLAWSSLNWRGIPCSLKYFNRKRLTLGALGFFLFFAVFRESIDADQYILVILVIILVIILIIKIIIIKKK